MKKILSIIIMACMLISFVTVVTFASENPFLDVDEKSWYYDEVMGAYAEGIMVGVSKTEFSPEEPVTREMFITALARTFEIDVSHFGTQFFADQQSGKWYYNALSWSAYETVNIASGIGTDKDGSKIFGVGKYVTREEMATFVYRLLNNNYLVLAEDKNAPAAFTDTPSKWATAAVEAMKNGGIISGYNDGSFKPKANATRAEVAAILLRLKKARETLSAKFNFDTDVSVITLTNKTEPITDTQAVKAITECINSATVTKAEYLKIYGYEQTREYLESKYANRVGLTAGVNTDYQLSIVEDGIIYNYYHYTLSEQSLARLNELIK